MGSGRKIECLFDLHSIQCDAAVVCMSCGRTAVYDPDSLAGYLRTARRPERLEDIGQHFSCRRCRSREIEVKPFPRAHRPEPLPVPDRPVPLYVLPPGRCARELAEAEKALAEALKEVPAIMPVLVRQADARERVRRARYMLRQTLHRGVDY